MRSELEEFSWITSPVGLGPSFCLTLVSGYAVDEAIVRLGAERIFDLPGIGSVAEAWFQVAHRPDHYESPNFYTDRRSGLLLASATTVSERTLLVDPLGGLSSTNSVIESLSDRGDFVSFYDSETNAPKFLLARAGQVLTSFDPMNVWSKQGSQPDILMEVITGLGFVSQSLEEREVSFQHDRMYRQRTLALMHRLTGVRLVAETLLDSTFRCAAVPDPNNIGASNLISDEYAAHARERLADYCRRFESGG